MPLEIKPAEQNDLAEILALQKLAFQSEAEIYGANIPPLTQTHEELTTDFFDYHILKARLDGQVVGSVRGRMIDQRTAYIGRLFVVPGFQNQGIGKKLMAAIEAEFPQADVFELATGSLSQKNLDLYQALGYQAFRQEEGHITNVFMIWFRKVKT